jgi:hypothetical protein
MQHYQGLPGQVRQAYEYCILDTYVQYVYTNESSVRTLSSAEINSKQGLGETQSRSAICQYLMVIHAERLATAVISAS